MRKLPEDKVPATAITTAPDIATGAEPPNLVKLLESFGELQDKLASAEAEVERLRASSDVARAELIKPYAWAVLAFVCGYGIVVAILLVLQGFGTALGFHIHDGVMGVIVGSTAVSAIGLVLTVVRGLFPGGSS